MFRLCAMPGRSPLFGQGCICLAPRNTGDGFTRVVNSSPCMGQLRLACCSLWSRGCFGWKRSSHYSATSTFLPRSDQMQLSSKTLSCPQVIMKLANPWYVHAAVQLVAISSQHQWPIQLVTSVICQFISMEVQWWTLCLYHYMFYIHVCWIFLMQPEWKYISDKWTNLWCTSK